MRSYIILFAIFFGGVVHLHSQSVSGYVNDLEDGRVLPFVSVTVQGTSIGTLSDIDGYFSLTPTGFPVTLTFHTLGYVDTTIVFNHPRRLKVPMREKALLLKAAVIEAKENPAIRIIKLAIENRDSTKQRRL